MKVTKDEVANWVIRILLSATIKLVVCVSIVFGSAASAQQPSSATIVGRWRSLETTKAGIGQVWKFGSDGTIDFSLGAVVEMPWRIEKNQLIVPPAAVGDPEQKYTLKWLGDNRLRLETEWGVAELARVGDGPDPGNPIIGEWIENRLMEGRNLEAHWLFYTRGKVLLLIPFAIEHYSYTIFASALQVKRQGMTREYRFKVADDLLTLSAPNDGQESRYARY